MPANVHKSKSMETCNFQRLHKWRFLLCFIDTVTYFNNLFSELQASHWSVVHHIPLQHFFRFFFHCTFSFIVRILSAFIRANRDRQTYIGALSVVLQSSNTKLITITLTVTDVQFSRRPIDFRAASHVYTIFWMCILTWSSSLFTHADGSRVNIAIGCSLCVILCVCVCVCVCVCMSAR